MIQDTGAESERFADHLAERLRRTLADHFAAMTRRHRRLLGSAASVLSHILCLSLMNSAELSSQELPQRQGRMFVDVQFGGELQARNCSQCPSSQYAGGPAIQAVVGAALGRGLGVGIAARAFQQFSYEYDQSSLYWLLIARYTLPKWNNLSLNAGVGHARHEADTTPGARYSEAGAAVSGGVTLRLPAYSRVGLTTNLGVIKTVGGRGDFRPLTATFGVGLNAVVW